MTVVNCFSMIFKNGRVCNRPGIDLLSCNEYFATLNGVDRWRIWEDKPKILPATEPYNIHYLENTLFKDVTKSPWIGKDADKYVLFSCHITDKNNYIKPYSEDKLYVMVQASPTASIRLLGCSGQLYFRYFQDKQQYALVSFPHGMGALAVDDEEHFMLVEYENDRWVTR